MTIIAAARTSRSVAIASDSLGSDGETARDYGSKLTRYEWGAVGFAGDYAPIQFIETALREVDAVETKRQSRRFVEIVRHALIEGGWLGQGAGDLPSCEGLCLLVVSARGAIWEVYSNLSILRPRKYAAIGSGSALALGAMHATHRTTSAPKIVEAGVRAAIAHQPGCGGRLHKHQFRLK